MEAEDKVKKREKKKNVPGYDKNGRKYPRFKIVNSQFFFTHCCDYYVRNKRSGAEEVRQEGEGWREGKEGEEEIRSDEATKICRKENVGKNSL